MLHEDSIMQVRGENMFFVFFCSKKVKHGVKVKQRDAERGSILQI